MAYRTLNTRLSPVLILPLFKDRSSNLFLLSCLLCFLLHFSARSTCPVNLPRQLFPEAQAEVSYCTIYSSCRKEKQNEKHLTRNTYPRQRIKTASKVRFGSVRVRAHTSLSFTSIRSGHRFLVLVLCDVHMAEHLEQCSVNFVSTGLISSGFSIGSSPNSPPEGGIG
ncbi:hypothetical protein VTL71DRAFT_9292 [Oculimacula yallundae]|uniref:Secreted protein n=1 Tax=Oculimacula yallundae TaxID=86028 RepID=A0ABR4BTW7_9HELO